MYDGGIQFVSCPTCGRTKIDLIALANEAQERLKDCKKNIKVAIMGCIVNGPGEAREADIGIAVVIRLDLSSKKVKLFAKYRKTNYLID